MHQVVAGTVSLTTIEGAHVHQVADIIAHPLYDSTTMENDIALLKVDYIQTNKLFTAQQLK